MDFEIAVTLNLDWEGRVGSIALRSRREEIGHSRYWLGPNRTILSRLILCQNQLVRAPCMIYLGVLVTREIAAA